MNRNQIEEKLGKIHCGSFTKVVYKTTLAADKDHKGVEVAKVVKAVVRIGVRYSEMASVKAKAAAKAVTGLSADLNKLPWGKWAGRFLIENKGQLYVRFACAKNNASLKPVVLGYYANGEKISEDEAKAMTRPSEWARKDDNLDVFNKRIEDVISIGK